MYAYDQIGSEDVIEFRDTCGLQRRLLALATGASQSDVGTSLDSRVHPLKVRLTVESERVFERRVTIPCTSERRTL